MLITNTKRIIKSGFMNFWRNGFVSLASVLIMIIALFVIGSVIFGTALLKNVLGELKDKADINVYFVTDATEGDILSLKQSLENLPQVAFVAYTSREEAFARFKERHKDDELMSQVFDILGENPLGASLTVKAREVSGYEAIAGFLTKENDALSRDSRSIIDDVNYFRNKVVIDRLSRIVDVSEKAGFILGALIVAISVVVTVNTIRLAIYISREEIAVMNLVGASSRYIRGPFVVSGCLYGLVAAAVTLVVFYVVAFWLERVTAGFFSGLGLFRYYLANFSSISAIIIISGVILGGVSSYFGVRRYLKV